MDVTVQRAEVLLAHIRQARELADLDSIRQHFRAGLVDFGITEETAGAYFGGEDGAVARTVGAPGPTA